MKRLFLLVFVLALSATTAGACVWGSFDATRINYAAGPLTGTAHSQLRAIIEANGGTIAPATPTLTASYLSGVDVFYTSLLSTSTGVLSSAEQDALHEWIAGGGTLVVTADIFPLPAYESFTAYYGVTDYTALSNNANGYPVADHPLTQGVTVYHYITESTFTYGADALLLGDNGFGSPFLIVLEPDTGFDAGGRIAVYGDHNMFTDSYIADQDNVQLATDLATWACAGPVPIQETTWGQVKSLFRGDR